MNYATEMPYIYFATYYNTVSQNSTTEHF